MIVFSFADVLSVRGPLIFFICHVVTLQLSSKRVILAGHCYPQAVSGRRVLLTMRKFVFHGVVFQLKVCALTTCFAALFLEGNALLAWSMGALLNVFGAAWMGWRSAPWVEQLPAKLWLRRWYRSLVLKWLWSMLAMAVIFSLLPLNVLYFWAGFVWMCVAQAWAMAGQQCPLGRCEAV